MNEHLTIDATLGTEEVDLVAMNDAPIRFSYNTHFGVALNINFLLRLVGNFCHPRADGDPGGSLFEVHFSGFPPSRE